MLNKKILQINTAYFDEDSNSIFKDSLKNSQSQSQAAAGNQTTFIHQYQNQIANDHNQQQHVSKLKSTKIIRQTLQPVQNNYKKQCNYIIDEPYDHTSYQCNRIQQNSSKFQNQNRLRYLNKKKTLVKQLHIISKQIPIKYTHCLKNRDYSSMQRHFKLQYYKNQLKKCYLIKDYQKRKNYNEQKTQTQVKRYRIYEGMLQKLKKINTQSSTNKQKKQYQASNNKFINNSSLNMQIDKLQDFITEQKLMHTQDISQSQQSCNQQIQGQQLRRRQQLFANFKKELQVLKVQIRRLRQPDDSSNITFPYSPAYPQIKPQNQEFHFSFTKQKEQTPFVFSFKHPNEHKIDYFSYHKQSKQFNNNNAVGSSNQYPHIKITSQEIRTFKIPVYGQAQIKKPLIPKSQGKQQEEYYPYIKQKILDQMNLA